MSDASFAPATTSVGGGPKASNSAYAEGDATHGQFFSVTRLRRQYLDYATFKADEIEEAREGRNYYHGAQWTAAEVRILRDRRQPVITYNRIGRKINGIVGLAEKQRQDPKAYPLTPKDGEGAQVATSTVRYICDSSHWKDWLKPECLRQAGIEGIAGVEMKLIDGDEGEGDPDIQLAQIFGEDFFYDPRSRKPDFTDARYKGIAKWLDIEAAIELFPDKEDELRALSGDGSDMTTNNDMENRWIAGAGSEQRLRLIEHWYKHKGKWFWAFYVGFVLLDEGLSPFVDAKNKSIPRFIMFSAAVDHDGDRYGFVRNLRGPQDEVNQRRSKALHISNSRRLIIDKGAVDDVQATRIEWARADGVIEKNSPALQVTPDNTVQDLASQFQFLEEAKNEIEAYANMNPAALAGPGVKNLSGRAVNMLQQPGLAELGPFLIAYRSWCLRVYSSVWCAAQKFWTAERWIRVTNDDKIPQFLQLNGLDVDQYGRPALVNALGALNVDIALDEGPDTVTSMSDSFDVLSQFPPGSVPPAVLIELSPIQQTVKDKLLEMMQPPPLDPVKQALQTIAVHGAAATVQKTQSETEKNRASALSSVASAAHKAGEAHLNAAQFERDGLQGTDVSSGESGAAPLAPQPAPAPLNPMMVPGAQPLKPNMPLAAHLMQTLRPPPRPLPGNGTSPRH